MAPITEYYHRLQPDQTPLKKIAHRHLPPTIVIGIADHKTRQQKKEVDGKIAVIDIHIEMTGGMRLAEMHGKNHNGRHTTQAI